MSLTLSEVGARWPEALVLWDRDVAEHVTWPVLFATDPDTNRLHAYDLNCIGRTCCQCLLWLGDAWASVSHEFGMVDRARLALVEVYRQKLGLRTQADQILRSWALGGGGYRQSGRTMFGLLEAIARCQIDGVSLLRIEGGNNANTSYCFNMARQLLEHLAIDTITVAPVRRQIEHFFPARSRAESSVLYTDHHAYEPGGLR